MKPVTKIIIFSILLLTVTCKLDKDKWNAFKGRLHNVIKNIDTASTYVNYTGCCQFDYHYGSNEKGKVYIHVKNDAACRLIAGEDKAYYNNYEYSDESAKCNGIVLRHCCIATAQDGTKFGYNGPDHLKNCYSDDQENNFLGTTTSCKAIIPKRKFKKILQRKLKK